MMTLILVFLFSFLATAQTQYSYQMEGSFNSQAGAPNTLPTVVNYSIFWNESADAIQGVYQDNYFTRGTPQILSGAINSTGRTFNVILPQEANGVKSLTLTSPQTGPMTGTVGMQVTTQSNVGSQIDRQNVSALMSMNGTAQVAQNQEEEIEGCSIGFGALTGFCGIYGGTINETADTSNSCDLLSYAAPPRLSLEESASFRMYLSYSANSTNTLYQNIGGFPPSPLSNTVNISGRTCGLLAGTTFPSPGCKTVTLTGVFIDSEFSEPSFNGTYTIVDQASGNTCSYSLALTREEVFQ